MKLLEILPREKYTYSDTIANLEIKNITSKLEDTDSETLFFLHKRINFDSGKIINDVIKLQPAAIVCGPDIEINTDIPLIRVKDTRLEIAFACAAFNKIDFSKTTFIAVTGTNGKTTTATMLHEIFRYSGNKVGFIGTGKVICNNDIISDRFYSMTTPDPPALYKYIKYMQDKDCKIIVMEVSSHSIALEKVRPIPFDYSIFTNLSEEHLDFHKNIENYYETKKRLFYQSKCGIFNVDCEYSARAMSELKDVCRTIGVGVLWDADTQARDVILYGLGGSSYIYKEANRIFKVKLKLAGYYNIYNSLMALRCAIECGVKPYMAKEAINGLNYIDGRLEIIKDAITVIIDYAHTPYAFENVLKTITSAKNTRQKLLTVFGCGGERDTEKRAKMGAVSQKYSDLSIVTEDNNRNEKGEKIIADILEGFTNFEKRIVIPSRRDAITRAILTADIGDIVLILGKGHERYTIDNSGYHDFDEREIVASALAKRNSLSKKLKTR